MVAKGALDCLGSLAMKNFSIKCLAMSEDSEGIQGGFKNMPTGRFRRICGAHAGVVSWDLYREIDAHRFSSAVDSSLIPDSSMWRSTVN